MLSLTLGVLGLGNYKLQGKFREEFFNYPEQDVCINNVIRTIYSGPEKVFSSDAPNYEYRLIGLFFGNFISVIRLSLGDFNIIPAAEYLTTEENYVFWIIWLAAVIVNCIVFLNFIVAEAGNTYNTISEQLEGTI